MTILYRYLPFYPYPQTQAIVKQAKPVASVRAEAPTDTGNLSIVLVLVIVLDH